MALQKNDVPKVKNCINQCQKFGGPCISKKTKCRTLSIRIDCAFCYNFDLAFILNLIWRANYSRCHVKLLCVFVAFSCVHHCVCFTHQAPQRHDEQVNASCANSCIMHCALRATPTALQRVVHFLELRGKSRMRDSIWLRCRHGFARPKIPEAHSRHASL